MKYCFLLLAITVTGAAFAQDFSYLENIELETSADFTPENDANAIKAADYLFKTPIDKKNNNRKFCYSYLSRYAAKAPAVIITIDPYWGVVTKGNEEMLQMVLGIWIRTALINKNAIKEEIEKKVFTEIYKYAKAGNNVKKTDQIKALTDAGDKAEVTQWFDKVRNEK